jgi:flagellar basal body P-ring formation protein FlgA
MTPRSCLVVAGIVGLALARGALASSDIEAIARITRVARDTAAASTARPVGELEVATLDPRLRLPACESTPTGRLTPGSRSPAQLTIEVRCLDPVWRQYVAVRVHAEETVVVAVRPLSRLQAVTADDIELLPRDLAALPGGFFRKPDEVIGRLAQRNVGAGEVLEPRLVRQPPLVKRGQSVTLIVRSAGINVRAPGIALAEGGLDERVAVRNAATSRLLEGVVRSSEVVEVALE